MMERQATMLKSVREAYDLLNHNDRRQISAYELVIDELETVPLSEQEMDDLSDYLEKRTKWTRK